MDKCVIPRLCLFHFLRRLQLLSCFVLALSAYFRKSLLLLKFIPRFLLLLQSLLLLFRRLGQIAVILWARCCLLLLLLAHFFLLCRLRVARSTLRRCAILELLQLLFLFTRELVLVNRLLYLCFLLSNLFLASFPTQMLDRFRDTGPRRVGPVGWIGELDLSRIHINLHARLTLPFLIFVDLIEASFFLLA